MDRKAEQGAPSARTTLVIDRSRWARGDGDGRLLRPSDGKMCCLGFFGLACGIPTGDLTDGGTPEECADSRWPEWLLAYDDERGHKRDTGACTRLVTINDEQATIESRRERDIAAEFAKHGVDVRFVDGASNG